MDMAQPGHIDFVKQVNAGRVYKLIDQKGPISRIDLSKESGLAPASITKITRELIDAYLIQETAVQEPTSRGRPAIGLQTKHEGWQFLSLRVGQGYLSIALHELGGEILIQTRMLLGRSSQSKLLTRILKEIQVFFDKNVNYLERMTCIAVTLPGEVNIDLGMVMDMPFYGVKNMPLGEEIHHATGLPVFVASDTRAWALAEKLFGNSYTSENSVLVVIEPELSAGVIVEGKVLHGRYGNIGDIGHIRIQSPGLQCECGHSGCFNTVASAGAICQEVQSRIDAGEPSCLTDLVDITLDEVCEAALAGDMLACEVIQRLGVHLGQAIAMLVNMFSPDKVLIGGVISKTQAILYPCISAELEAQCLPRQLNHLTLTDSRFYNESTMPGAALVKQALYDGSLLLNVIEG